MKANFHSGGISFRENMNSKKMLSGLAILNPKFFIVLEENVSGVIVLELFNFVSCSITVETGKYMVDMWQADCNGSNTDWIL